MRPISATVAAAATRPAAAAIAAAAAAAAAAPAGSVIEGRVESGPLVGAIGEIIAVTILEAAVAAALAGAAAAAVATVVISAHLVDLAVAAVTSGAATRNGSVATILVISGAWIAVKGTGRCCGGRSGRMVTKGCSLAVHLIGIAYLSAHRDERRGVAARRPCDPPHRLPCLCPFPPPLSRRRS